MFGNFNFGTSIVTTTLNEHVLSVDFECYFVLLERNG